MTQEEIRIILNKMAEEKYRKFSASLLPGVDNILGVRLPKLRMVAKKIAKEDWRLCMAWKDKKYFEETMLQAMVLGYAKADINELLAALAGFIPYIDNWSVNDSLCSSFKAAEQYPQDVWDFLMGYKDSGNEFEARFVAVMLRAYYINDNYIDKTLEVLGNIDTTKYYASMGTAWAFADAWAAYGTKTKKFLKEHTPDSTTYLKTLQKCLESYKISVEDKEYIKKEKNLFKMSQNHF